MNEQMLTIREFAVHAHHCDSWVRDKCRRGDIKSTKLGRKWLIPESEVDDYPKRQSSKVSSKIILDQKPIERLLIDHKNSLVKSIETLINNIGILLKYQKLWNDFEEYYEITGDIVNGGAIITSYEKSGAVADIVEVLEEADEETVECIFNHYKEKLRGVGMMQLLSMNVKNADPVIAKKLKHLARNIDFKLCPNCSVCSILRI
jgi:excisionase family DNA binding protein